MKKGLLIAEKPSLRRTIESVYNKHRSEIPYEITFKEQRGHLLTLKMPNELDEDLKEWSWDTLPINPEDYGGWRYKTIAEEKKGSFLTSKERFDEIRDEYRSGKYDFIIHAGDPDQEGELLVKIVLLAIKNSLPVKRYWSNDTTEEKVLEALKNLKDDDNDPMLKNLFAASIGRQHSDYRVGINLSRAATLKLGVRTALGRVKTPIMSIVCQREKDIQSFTPTTVYGVKVDYDAGFSGQMYDGSAEADTEEKESPSEDTGLIWFDTKEEAEDVIENLDFPATVISYDKKKTTTYAPKLYKLATAQVEAGKHGYTSSRTLEIIQGLYEKGFLSYPRTDCEYLSSGENLNAMIKSASVCPDLKSYIDEIAPSAISKVRGTKKWINDKKLEEAGHSALVPTSKAPDYAMLSEDEKFIYTLICRRFVAIFLPPLIKEETVLITDISGHTFKSTGKTVVDEGYSKIFGTKFTDTEIPEYESGDEISSGDFSIAEKTSTCPKRFTDATIIQMCEAPHKFLEDASLKALGEHLSIGTPATRASIIEELIVKDKYLKREKSGKQTNIVPTDTGMAIYDALHGRDITKVDMTGRWELMLEDIRAGKLSLKDFENNMIQDVADMVEDIKDSDIEPIGSSAKRTAICTCPECGGDIISGPKSFFCSNYKEKGCKVGNFKKICNSPIKDEDFAAMLNGEEITMKVKKGSNSWNQRLKYDFEEHKVAFVQSKETESSYYCPNCGSAMKENDRVISCADDCGFKFWKTSCGKALSNEEIRKFFEEGDTGLVSGLKSKAGKPFKANIVFDKDRNSTKFVFPPRE